MDPSLAYEDAVDLLDADHKAVKQLFIDYNALCDDDAPADARQALAEQICNELTVHAQIEEEIFYPAVRDAIDDDDLIDEAVEEHAEAKETIAEIQDMSVDEPEYDDTVRLLGEMIDQHVLEEREEIFLKARYAAMDLKALAVELFERKQELLSEMAESGDEESA